MVRTRIRNEQGEDIGFVSEREFNDFFADVVITGTNEDTDITTTFENYLPGRGIFVGSDGTTVTTGTNTINITGFYTEFVSSSGVLQDQISGLGGGGALVNDITASGVTITGSVTFEGISGVTLVPNASTNTITWSGAGVTKIITVSGIEGDVTFSGAGEVDISTEGNTIVISGTEHTPVPNAIVGGENVTVVSGSNETVISATAAPPDAIVGAGEVVVISGSNEVIVSGTPHTENTDTISDAIVGGVGIVVTSGSNETTIDGHLRYTKDENDAIIGGENVTVVSGTDTITVSSVDTISDAIIGGVGVTVTSGSNETTIDGHLRYQKNENDAILGTDGNTVISGANTITIEGFRPEFVSASGSLQSQIDAVEGSDVDSINALIGDVTIAPGYNATVDTNGGSNTITVGTFDDDDVDSITASGTTITGTVELFGTDDLTVTPATTPGGGTFTFTADPGIVRNEQLVSFSGSVNDTLDFLIEDVIPGIESPATTVQGGFTAFDEALSTTTATTFQNKLNLTADVTVVFTGTGPQPFRLIWYYEWGYSSASSEIETQITVDDVDQVGTIQWGPASTNASHFAASSGYADMTLTSGTHSFDLDYRSTANGKTSRIQRARLALSPMTLGPNELDPPSQGT